MKCNDSVILSGTKWSRRILAEQRDRGSVFSSDAEPGSFDSALPRSAQDDKVLIYDCSLKISEIFFEVP
jgi:hypothetical protein